MKNPEAIFAAAAERGKQLGLPYAGAVLPNEAHALQGGDAAVIVDVRTAAELAFVGRVAGAAAAEWQTYPGMEVNPRFMEEVTAQTPAQTPIVFMCRSGARSHNAAVAAAAVGLTAYNMLEGFEGDLNEERRRNAVNGWRARGLPWEQS